jgi:hypothetical protein
MNKDDPKFQASLRDPAPNNQPPEPSIYEQICAYLYDYRFGRITFLELLDKWKEVLKIPTKSNQ